DCTPPATALRSMQTGQNSIASANSLPQLGQVRRGSVLMALTTLRMRLGAEKNLGSGPVHHPGSARGVERTCRGDTNTAGTARPKRSAPLASGFAPPS